MSEVTENGKTFKKFIKDYSFVITDYQRAYSWGEKQIIPFINDILEHIDDNDDPSDDTKYYLGHYILENSTDENIFEIIDGQQRITTVYLFLLVCGYFNKNKEIYNFIKFLPVTYDREGLENIKSILESNEDVKYKLENLLTFEKTMSLARMVMAVQIFIDAFEGKIKKLDFEKIEKYVKVIFDAHCSVALFKDKAVASQIFELHNTRGIALSETEKVKALLMKSVYINSENPDKEIEVIQEAFAKVFKMEEKVSENWLRGDMPLDTVLMYHLRAVEDGVKVENFGSPNSISGENGSFEYVRKAIALKGNNKSEVLEYSKNIAIELAKSMKILTIEIPKADKQNNNHLIGDILLLDRSKSLVFLLRAFRVNETIDYNLIERWENFMLCYEIIYWNGFFYNKRYRGDFNTIYASLKSDFNFEECKNLLFEYYDGNGKSFGSDWGNLKNNTLERFTSKKNQWMSNTYEWDKVGYFLYKFEIQNGGREKIEKIRTDIFKDDKVSIDHIVARGLTWKSLGFTDYDTLPEDNEQKKQANKLWKDIWGVINGIGNLALSTASNNSSDSNGLPKEHFGTFEKCGFIETAKQVETWVNPEQFASKINKRSEDIIEFISEKIINQDDIWK
jgi:hypothetical protein